MNEQQREKIHAYIDAQRETMIDSLATLIRIPSVKEPPATDAPFGTECARALHHTLALAEQLGMATKNLDNYIGYAELGEGDSLFGLLCHLDVVPEGDGWIHPCFGAEIEDGKMYGRGVLDDKGPALSALYAMAAIREAGIPLKRRVRLLLGCDEESGWEDIAYYRQHDVLPDMAISPDGGYPVVNVEKGILQVALRGEWAAASEERRLLSIIGGTRPNVVPGKAEAVVAGVTIEEIRGAINALSSEIAIDFDVQEASGGASITAIGLGAHASHPEMGRNAISGLLQLLNRLALDANGGRDTVARLAAAFPLDGHDGHAVGIRMEDQISGPLTCNLGLIEGGDGMLQATVDLRIPLSASSEAIMQLLGSETGLSSTLTSFSAPHYVSEKSELVQTLLDVYAKETGLPSYCYAIGGGTYARAIENAVTFGCLFPGEADTMHQPEECVSLDNFILNTKIIAAAIVALCG